MTNLADPPPNTYSKRIECAIDYLRDNLIDRPNLDAMAEAANFSKYHFHRLFKIHTGETVTNFASRLRIERAIKLMTSSPHLNMTDIAFRSGFDSSSDFSRSFKKRFGIPPTAFDPAAHRNDNRQQNTLPAPVETPSRRFVVEIRELPARHVAYKRITRPYEGTRLCDGMAELLAWADECRCASGAWIGYSWDDPDVTPLDKCTYDIAVVITSPDLQDKRVSWRKIPAMKVAQIHISGDLSQEMEALDWLYKSWLPSSKYLPADHPCFEAFGGRPEANDTNHYELDIQVPISSD